MRVRVLVVVLHALLLLDAAKVHAANTPLRGIAIDQRLDAEPIATDVPDGLPVIVRLSVDQGDFTGPAGADAFARLRARLELYKSRRFQSIVAVPALPSRDDEVENWRQFVRTIAERSRDLAAAFQLGEVPFGTSPDVARYTYLLKLAAVQIRSLDPDLLVVQGPIPATAVEWERQVIAAGIGPYVGGLALAGPVGEPDTAFRDSVQRFVAFVEREQPSMMIILGPTPLPTAPGAAVARLMDTEARVLGTKVRVNAYTVDAAAIPGVLRAAGRFVDLIGGDLVPLDERAAGLRIARRGAEVTSGIQHRLLYSLTNFATYLVYWDAAEGPLEVDVSVANAATLMVRDLADGSSQPPEQVGSSERGAPFHLRLPASARPLVVDFNFGAANVYVQATEVSTQALPRVEEIIFRYQQVQAAQDAALDAYIAHVRIEQHFHPSPADPAYNIVTENRLYADRQGLEWEELSFELNGARWTSNRPAFPLVQPEKVLSLPLDLRLNQDYTYRLDGVDLVDEHPVFVVRFNPVDSTRALYRGSVWIDRQTFVRVKVQAVETKSSGLVVSNDETQSFSLAGTVQGRPIWLPSRLESRQIFLIAGRNVLVERQVRLSSILLNPQEFESERKNARTSSRIMYRDTDQGIRYFVKKGSERVVSEQLTTSARAFALGADVDPSFEFPLPIGGLNILDFNFLDRNMQLALLFGGVIALGNIQRPGLLGGKVDLSVDFFGLALKANNDVFDGQGRRAGERVNRIPASTGFNIGYQISPFHKVTGHYEFKYDAYFRDLDTSSSFAIPSNTATNGAAIGYEYRRRGYSLAANIAAYRRTTWNEWGTGAGFDPNTRTYDKYDAGLSKDFVFATFHTVHLNATYFGGQRLDRFSMYEFGLFDPTRMHGVPSAVRFAELGMVRASYSFNVFDQYRIDLFLDHAGGREATEDSWQQVTGTGVRLNLRAPRSTILQLDIGKSFLPAAFRGAGSTVIQILLLKPL